MFVIYFWNFENKKATKEKQEKIQIIWKMILIEMIDRFASFSSIFMSHPEKSESDSTSLFLRILVHTFSEKSCDASI